jgi:hypothetical protein
MPKYSTKEHATIPFTTQQSASGAPSYGGTPTSSDRACHQSRTPIVILDEQWGRARAPAASSMSTALVLLYEDGTTTVQRHSNSQREAEVPLSEATASRAQTSMELPQRDWYFPVGKEYSTLIIAILPSGRASVLSLRA